VADNKVTVFSNSRIDCMGILMFVRTKKRQYF